MTHQTAQISPNRPSLAEIRARARWLVLRAARDAACGDPDEGSSALLATSSAAGDPASAKVVQLVEMRRRAGLRLSQLLEEQQAYAHPGREYDQTPLQRSLASWLADSDFNVMVTLTFASERGVSMALAKRIFGQFLPRLRKAVQRKGSRQKIPMLAVIEESREQLQALGLNTEGREGTHVHVLMRLRGDDLYVHKSKIRAAWKATNRLCGDPYVSCPNSDEWFLPLWNSFLRETYANYVLKSMEEDTLGLLVEYMHLD